MKKKLTIPQNCGINGGMQSRGGLYFDKWTGKPIDKPSDALPSNNGELCDECGTELIDKCYRCGAPVCCPKCCYKSTGSEK